MIYFQIDIQEVFNLINQNRTGFVNYEEFKTFIYSKGLYI